MTKAATYIMRRVGNRLEPVDPWSAEKLEQVKEGEQLTVTIARNRSLSQNNLFHAGLAYAVENIFEGELATHYPTAKHLKRALLLSLGYSEVIHRIDGSAIVMEDSTRFEAMDADEFSKFFDGAQRKFWEWMQRDPWEEWLEEKRAADALRRARR